MNTETTLAIAIARNVKLVQVHPHSFKVLVKGASGTWYFSTSSHDRGQATRSFLLQCEARA